ncbi:MAG: hypothetical protein ACFFD2_10080, partial [Promethearchaeota archaeon]
MKIYLNFRFIIGAAREHLALFIPIGAPYREFLLLVEAITLIINLQICVLYVRKYLKTKTNYSILAWGGLLFAFSIINVCYIIADFYINSEIIRQIILNLSYIIGSIGVLIFSFNIEREIKLTKHLISIVFLGLIGLLIINMIFSLDLGLYIVFICWLIFIIVITIYSKKFTSKINDRWKVNVYSLVIGSILFTIGFAMTADAVVAAFGGIWIRFLGDFTIIIGVLLVSLLFIGVPSLKEFDWFQTIKYLDIL